MNAPIRPETLPQWRFDDLYAGRDDPRIAADLAEAERANNELLALNRLSDPQPKVRKRAAQGLAKVDEFEELVG